MLYLRVHIFNSMFWVWFISTHLLLVESQQSTQFSQTKVTQIKLPPEAKILPKTPDSKILVPSLENNNLRNRVNTTTSQDATVPPPYSYIVRHRPNDGEFDSIQAALSALKQLDPSGLNFTQTIFIYPGNYVEKLIVDYKGPLRIMGYTGNRYDYSQNQVNITGSMDAILAGSDELSATMRIIKDDFSMYNINVYNTYGHQGHLSQAIALSGTGSKQAYYACSFFGYQDTLLTLNGYHYYSQCYIEGAIDFIFTQKAVVWFERVTTGSTAPGVVSANGRNDAINPSRYVFNRAKILSKGAPIGSVFLGRPWGNYSRVTFQFSYLSEVVQPLGWTFWNKGDSRTNHALYSEYKNFGPGAVLYPPNSTTNNFTIPGNNRKPPNATLPPPIVENSTSLGVPPWARAPFSRERKRPAQVKAVLGKDYRLWVDPDFPVDPF